MYIALKTACHISPSPSHGIAITIITQKPSAKEAKTPYNTGVAKVPYEYSKAKHFNHSTLQ